MNKNKNNMKNIILAVLVISFVSCKAQMNIYPIGTGIGGIDQNQPYYVKDVNNHHEAIVGVWKWQDGNESFEITIQEFEMYTYAPASYGVYRDMLFGKYKYELDGEIICETTEILPFPSGNLALTYGSPIEYFIQIKDVISLKRRVGEFKLINSTTASWQLWISEGLKVGFPETGIDFLLPTGMFLTKQ